MKKIFILATAAIVAFASCMKTEIVSNSEPQEIAFRQFTGSMTKVDPTDLADFASTMGVFGYHTNNGTTTPYIQNGDFAKNSGDNWGGESKKYYWPPQGTMDFTVYAPYDASAVYNNDTKTLSISVDNTSTQTDYLYGKEQYIGKTKSASALSVALKHALSKVIINVKTDAASSGNIKVTSVSLLSTIQDATYNVVYSSDTPYEGTISFPTKGDADNNLEYSDGNWTLTETDKTNSMLVVPSTQTNIVIKYKMGEVDTELTAKLDLTGDWETGKRYTYNITITTSEILFAPTVEEWATGTGKDVTVPEP